MKNFILFLTVLVLPLVSCTNITEPSVEPTSNNFDLDKSTDFQNMPNRHFSDDELIPLPPKAPEWQDSVITVSQTINGADGGKIIMYRFYVAADGSIITISAKLQIPKLAFEGDKEITLNVDDEYAAVHFYPKMTFTKPLLLTYSITGLDLSNCNTGTIDFVYVDDNGNVEKIRDNGIQVIIPQGFVRVMYAQLWHFSRYAFSRAPIKLGRQPRMKLFK